MPSAFAGDVPGDEIVPGEIHVPAPRVRESLRLALASSAFRVFVRYHGEDGGSPTRRGDFWGALFDSDVPIPWMLFDRFMRSRDFRFRVAPIIRIYFACVRRAPDPEGLRHWTRCAAAGATLEEIAEAFCGSGEFLARHGALDAAGFVHAAYRNTLRRAPHEEELAFWSTRLGSGTLTRGRLLAGFSNSPEHEASLEHEVYVTMMYIGLLQRCADDAGLEYWAAQRRAADPQLLQRFVSAARSAG